MRLALVEGFPSGQRDQTVNLTALPSKVRILLPPPSFRKPGLAPGFRIYSPRQSILPLHSSPLSPFTCSRSRNKKTGGLRLPFTFISALLRDEALQSKAIEDIDRLSHPAHRLQIEPWQYLVAQLEFGDGAEDPDPVLELQARQ